MRYQVIELIQLVFALSLILGAFVGGLAVGWWRWGRRNADEEATTLGRPAGVGALFSPEERGDEIILSEVRLDGVPADASHGVTAGSRVFGTGAVGAGATRPALSAGISGVTAGGVTGSNRTPPEPAGASEVHDR